MLTGSQIAATPTPKSILKPTISLSPLRPIPARKSAPAANLGRSPSRSPGKQPGVQQEQAPASPIKTGLSPSKAQGRSPRKVASVQEQNDQAQDELDNAQTERQKAREEAIKQRDLRRKSLG